MFKVLKLSAVALGAAVLAACSSSVSSQTGTVSTSTAHGTLAQNPPFRIGSDNAAAVQALIGATAQGAYLLEHAGNPICGVDLYYITYWTVGAAGESTVSSGALMVPTGAAPACSGPRPIVLYAHATQFSQTFNITNIQDPSNIEGQVLAAVFAAQGYIVVAPNYAGYDISTLGYHPFFNAVQQSGEMMDILAAARTALPNTLSSAASDNGQLFLTGYSEGGFVAMATLRAMEAVGAKVTAAAPLSGLYALEAETDLVMYGGVAWGGPEFIPLFANSYQHAYGNIVSAANPIFSTTYPDALTVLPSTMPLDTLFQEGLLPDAAVFDSTTPVIAGEPALTAALAIPSHPVDPLSNAGFGNPYLIENDYRVSYVEDAASNPDGAFPTPVAGVPVAKLKPTQGLRQDVYLNDLRNVAWIPTVPTLLCGGDEDPTVFFSLNAETMVAFWQAMPAWKALPPALTAELVTVLDVSATPAGAFAPLQTAFQEFEAGTVAELQTAAGGGLTLEAAEAQVLENYHTDVQPFCALGARAFFSHF